MQAALYITPSSLPHFLPTKSLASTWRSGYRSQTTRSPLIRLASTPNDTSVVDYSSAASVFPAEACDTVGGDACAVEMYPETKLNPEAKSGTPRTTSEPVEREYLEYNSPKTVFPDEACDDLGGEFCDPEYQKGVN